MGRHNSTTLHLIGFDLSWRTEKSSLVMHFHLLVPKSNPATKRHFIVSEISYFYCSRLLWPPHCRGRHTLPLCATSVARDSTKETLQGALHPLCLNSCDSYVAPSPKISEYLLLYRKSWQPWSPLIRPSVCPASATAVTSAVPWLPFCPWISGSHPSTQPQLPVKQFIQQ